MQRYPFELKPLKYPYNALEPYIDAETVMLHHDKHLKKYVDTLNNLLKNYPIYHNYTLDELILKYNTLPPEISIGVKNNAGGVYNHNMYFDMLTPNRTILQGSLKEALIDTFGSLEEFYKQFTDRAMKVFGSGYAFLVVDKDRTLKIIQTANQDVPIGVCNVLIIDVWEHAYYLKYKNRRDEYIDKFKNIINWEKAQKNYDMAMNYLK